MEKIVDGIKMSEVKAPELAEMVKKFNSAKLGVQVKAGANPLGTVKAFVKAVESLDEDKQAMLPDAVSDYYNRIVVSDEELDAEADAFNAAEEKRKAEAEKQAKDAAKKAEAKKPAAKAEKKPTAEKKPAVAQKAPAAPKAAAVEKKPQERTPRGSISDDMTICIVEEKAPKRPGTIAWNNFQQYKKYPLVKDFLKKSNVDAPRKVLAFDKYHGRIVLK